MIEEDGMIVYGFGEDLFKIPVDQDEKILDCFNMIEATDPDMVKLAVEYARMIEEPWVDGITDKQIKEMFEVYAEDTGLQAAHDRNKRITMHARIALAEKKTIKKLLAHFDSP